MTRLLRLCDGLAMVGLAILLAVVAGAILGRLIFDLTGGALDLQVPGAIELSRYALLVLIVSALPGAAARGLVRVDLLIGRLPPSLSRSLDRLWHACVCGIGGICAWLLALEALRQADRGDTTQDLGWPLWIFTGYAAMGCAMLALVGLWRVTVREPRA